MTLKRHYFSSGTDTQTVTGYTGHRRTLFPVREIKLCVQDSQAQSTGRTWD